MQVSFKPPLLAISINPEHYSYQLLLASGVCTVNVLGEGQLLLSPSILAVQAEIK
jgi:flavin reductase (DIM6/NTAB) family NADH-FMN oxidoreductase RutF